MPSPSNHNPSGYQWVRVWPTNAPRARRLTGGALLVGAILAYTEHWLSFANATVAGVLGLALISGSGKTPRPTVHTNSDGRPKLSPNALKNPNFQGLALLECAGILAIWNGITGQAPGWFIWAGGVMAVTLAPILCLPFVTRSQRYIVFGEHELRVVNTFKKSGLDRRYPWASISNVELLAEVSSRATLPSVIFQCPHESVIENSVPDRPDYLRDGQDSWRIPVLWWNVEVNAFLATLRYFAAEPAMARNATASDVRSMLTAPNWVHRRQAPRQPLLPRT